MLLFYLSLIENEEEKSKLEKLYYEYKKLMKYIAFEILDNNELAEDAVHEAFIKLTRHLKGIEEIKCHKTKAFIVIVIRSVCFDMLEKEKNYKHSSLTDITNTISVPDGVLENLELEEICLIIKSLPDIHRDIIELKVYYEKSDKEIADISGISHTAVRKRLQRARNALKERLNEQGAEDDVLLGKR